jgi:hypothetical protein
MHGTGRKNNTFVEAQIVEYVGEGDIKRVSDDYLREKRGEEILG